MNHRKLTAAAASSLLFVGCVGVLAPATALAKDQQVTLKMILWTNAPTVQAIKTLNSEFHAKYPNITIQEVDVPINNYPQLEQTRLTAKDVDIVANQAFTNETPSWAPKAPEPTWQQWLDAKLFTSLDGQSFVKNYARDAETEASSYKGHVYGIETGSVAYNGIFYNKDIFKKYKLTPPKTWQQFVNICTTLDKNGVSPLIMGGKDGWPQWLPGQGIFAATFANAGTEVRDLWNGKADFTDPGMLWVAMHIKQLWSFAKPGWLGVGYSDAMSYFAAGQAAMLPDGTWDLPSIQQANPHLNFGYFAIPNATPGANNFLAGKYDLQWLLPSSSKNKSAVLKWMAFVSQPANYRFFVKATGFIPTQATAKYAATGDAAADIMRLNKHFKLALDQVLIGRNGIQGGQPGDVIGSWSLLQPQGNLTPTQWAALSQKAWNATKSQN